MSYTFSIITVCWNAEREIKKTIQSVVNQSFTDYEYIIIDGQSKDSTLKIVNEQLNKNENAIIVSERDDGIYDAMNKAIRLSHGKWLLFLNAGDYLHDSNVLSNVIEYLEDCDDFVYGDAMYFSDVERYLVKAKPISEIAMGTVFCHQCVFNRAEAISDYFFDTKYKICADYDLYVRAYVDGKKFKHIDMVVSDYSVGGYSQKNQFKLCEEIIDVRNKNNFVRNARFEVIKRKARVVFGRIAKMIIPQSIIHLIRKQ